MDAAGVARVTTGPRPRVRSFLLTLVRHGETHANKDGIVAGQTDAPLSVVGVSQAARLGTRFAAERFTLWMSSDLCRARDTAEVVMAANEHAAGAELKIDPRLRERHWGEAEGMSWTELKALATSRSVKLSHFEPVDCESRQVFRARVACFFNYVCRLCLAWPEPCPCLYLSGAEPVSRLCAEALAEVVGSVEEKEPVLNVVVFTHGGFARELSVLLESELGCDFKGRPASSPVSNTGVTRFLVRAAADAETGRLMACAECLMLRDTSHLDD